MTNVIKLFLLVVLFGACSPDNEMIQTAPYDLVNPFIGTGGHGHTFPGATAPFGMVQLSPDTRLDGWDGCSAYHYSDDKIYGFSHTHLSGTGVSDYGDILLMPFHAEEFSIDNIKNQDLIPSLFDKSSEKASPGYYEVNLADDDIDVELTCTERVGIHKYRFNKNQQAKVLIDLNHRDKVLGSSIEIIDNKTIQGKRISNAWAQEQHVYFYVQFSEPFESVDVDKNIDSLYTVISFQAKELLVKVGISAVSINGAKANLSKEANHWDFEKYKSEIKKKWEAQLSKIRVKDQDETKLINFYSALYHTMIAPNLWNDVTGEYRGHDGEIHMIEEGRDFYTVFSLWDTFRSTHPLYCIIERERTEDFMYSFLKIFEQSGRLPVWELAGNETDCMIGYHSASVIADALVKGIKDFDNRGLASGVLRAANEDHFGLESYKKNDYIRADDEAESVSKTLEYAYDDWCLSVIAQEVGYNGYIDEYEKRSLNYRNLFNPKTGFFQPKRNGNWIPNFKPEEVNFHFTEANAWQYSMFAPHDINGLINLHGGPEYFEKHLDNLFTTSSETSGRDQADITGLIGQYAHGNEPSHHMAYLYNYIGYPEKGQKRLDQIIENLYTNQPDGLSGNEDCGQMSSWYVMSAMGFYPVTPGSDLYVIGAPQFDTVEIAMPFDQTFSIYTAGEFDGNNQITSARLNGEDYKKSFFYHEELKQGRTLEFTVGAEETDWGYAEGNKPISRVENTKDIKPIISAISQSFSDSLEIEIITDQDSIMFLDVERGVYVQRKMTDNKFFIKESTKLIVGPFLKEAGDGYSSRMGATETAQFFKYDKNLNIEIHSEYANEYSGGGDRALIDALRGANNFKTGRWQGYQGQDIELTLDLGEEREFSEIKVGALQDIKSWIWFPESIVVLTSHDGENYENLGVVENDFSEKEYGSHLKELTLKTTGRARYLKLGIKNRGDCPDWHLGAEGKTWIFLDEISIQ